MICFLSSAFAPHVQPYVEMPNHAKKPASPCKQFLSARFLLSVHTEHETSDKENVESMQCH